LAELLPSYCLKAKAENTSKKYRYAFDRFTKWCKSFEPPVENLPTTDVNVALYLIFIAQNYNSASKIHEATHAIAWTHNLAGFPNPCDSTLVKFTKEGCLRDTSLPVTKKDPITPEILSSIVSLFGHNQASLLNLRTCAIFLLGYAGFLRFSEIVNILRSHVTFCDSHMKVFIQKSKTDVHSKGNYVYISRTFSPNCPVNLLERYLRMSGIEEHSNEYIFRQLSYCKKSDTYKIRKRNVPLSYTRVREIVLSTLQTLGLDSTKFGVHSLRSGGATTAAASGVNDRIFKKHGRWKSDNAKDGYVHESLECKLSVTKNLGI
jgi:integrase